MERRNKKTKSVGNGEGSLYKSETLNCWVYQYYLNGKRKTLKQRKGESVTDFKKRVIDTKNKLNNGTFIAKSSETVVTLLISHIERKNKDGTTSDRSYARDLETLEQIKKTCSIFCNKPIQNVSLDDIQKSKENIKQYAQTTIDKIWCLLGKAFKMANSPSRRLITFNLMLDEELKKPISVQVKQKVKPLSREEHEKLMHILDNEERTHKYRNIIKMQDISGMRIGEVLARSVSDYSEETKEFNIHNTLTEDKNYRVIWSEHTKTYNKRTQIDEGQRYLPLDTELFSELVEIIEEQKNKKVTNIRQLLFWDYENNFFVTPKQVDAWLSRINKKYQICMGNLTSHRLRHGAISYWRNELNLPMPVVQYLAGHVEGSHITDNVYVDTSFEYVKDQLKKIV